MINKKEAKRLFSLGWDYNQIAEKFGVTRQRIHQIIKLYKNTGRSGRIKKYRNFGICTKCKSKPANVLHHIDYNNKNDRPENLSAVCHTCHGQLHSGIKRKKYHHRTGDYLLLKRWGLLH